MTYLEHGAGAQECDQLILDLFRLLFQLAVDPTVDFPVVIDQTVLLQEVISIFVFGHLARIVIGLAVYFDCNLRFRRFQRKINVTVPTVNIHARVLNLQIFSLFWAERLTEQLNKQFFRTAVDTGCF